MMIMITLSFSAMRGPMLSMVSGFLGESGLGNDSHFSYMFGIDTPKDSPSYRETMLPGIFGTPISRGTVDYAWIRLRRHAGHLRLPSSNGPV